MITARKNARFVQKLAIILWYTKSCSGRKQRGGKDGREKFRERQPRGGKN